MLWSARIYCTWCGKCVRSHARLSCLWTLHVVHVTPEKSWLLSFNFFCFCFIWEMECSPGCPWLDSTLLLPLFPSKWQGFPSTFSLALNVLNKTFLILAKGQLMVISVHVWEGMPTAGFDYAAAVNRDSRCVSLPVPKRPGTWLCISLEILTKILIVCYFLSTTPEWNKSNNGERTNGERVDVPIAYYRCSKVILL